MNTAETLRAAAERVRRGWFQGADTDGNGRYCALGALMVVGGDEGWLVGRLALMDALRIQSVAVWNDSFGQTAENVAQGLEYAALLLEQEQAQQAEQPQPELVTQ